MKPIKWLGPRPIKNLSVAGNVLPEPGVYLLFYNFNDNLKVFYAGTAKNLQSRLLGYAKEKGEDQCIKTKIKSYNCSFFVAQVHNEFEREGVESYLIRLFEPECNDIIPSAAPIMVNIPEDLII